MVFGHSVFDDVFNSVTYNLVDIIEDYQNCDITWNLAYQRLYDIGNSYNEAIDILNENPRDCDDDGDPVVEGCTDPDANNYDPEATVIGILTPCLYDGCMDPLATNYDERATDDPDDSCIYDEDDDPIPGCMDEDANNYDEDATVYDPMFPCVYDVVGCMDETACNYDETATEDSEDCKYGDECGVLDGLEDWHYMAGAILLVVLLK